MAGLLSQNNDVGLLNPLFGRNAWQTSFVDPNRTKQLPFKDQFMNFIQSPELGAFATGLLENSSPSFTESPTISRAMGKGFSNVQEVMREKEKQMAAARIADAKNKMAEKIANQKNRMAQAKLDLEREKLTNPSVQNLTGPAQEYASLEALKQRFGEDSSVYKDAKKFLDIRMASQEQMTANRKKYLETADKRASTNLGKLEIEKQEIQAGYLPGSGGTVELSPEQQQVLLSRYDLMEQKISSDSDTRKRAIFAANIDKTVANIDIDALTQYAGIQGATKKALEKGGAALGKTSEGYKKYTESLAASKLLAKQIRQFYGESITPAATEAIDAMVNPATWKNNPELAKAAYEKVIEILEQETETIRGGLTGTESFKKEAKGPSSTGTTPVYRNGKKYMVPNDKVEEALASGGSLNEQ